MAEKHSAENDAPCGQCAEHLAEIARQGREITRLSARPSQADAEMRAFLDGWFAHARNPEGLVVEDAWHARLARPIPPAECACGHPSDDHDDEGACMHLCDCAWPIPPAETTKETR